LIATLAVAGAASPQRAARLLPLHAPKLSPFDGKSHADYYVLKGEIDSVRVGSFVRVYRNGAVLDSVSGSVDTLFSIEVPLLVGDNTFIAVLRDAKFNESPQSNRVSVVFDTRSGMYIPVPMTPGAILSLNSTEPATKAELRIFDTAGDLVIRFEGRDSRTYYAFPWDGKNGSYLSVRRGPLVAVGTIDYPDGTRDVLRQVFLYDPQGSP
jgi:hypothetical protein